MFFDFLSNPADREWQMSQWVSVSQSVSQSAYASIS